MLPDRGACECPNRSRWGSIAARTGCSDKFSELSWCPETASPARSIVEQLRDVRSSEGRLNSSMIAARRRSAASSTERRLVHRNHDDAPAMIDGDHRRPESAC